MNVERKREGLTVCDESHNGSIVASDNAADKIVEISSTEQDELVAATTPKDGAQDAVMRQLPVYWGHTLTVLCRELSDPHCEHQHMIQLCPISCLRR